MLKGISEKAGRNNLIGVAALACGVVLVSVQDVIMKQVSGAHAVTLVILLRSLISFPILLLLIHFESGLRAIATPRWRQLFLRGSIMLGAYTSYYMAFPALPLAEAVALFFMAPLFVTILSGPMLGEKVSPKALIAVTMGLAGVFVILRPGSALFEPAALLSLLSAAAYAFAMVLARRWGRDTPATVISFYQNVTYIVGVSIFAAIVNFAGIDPPGHPSLDYLLRPWVWPRHFDLTLIIVCGFIAALAVVLLTHGYRMGQASVVAPFEFTGMIWAAFWGFAIFGEVPRLTTFIGMALIAAAGVLALRAGSR
jgi:drug/metabolite transporter (DMT)-like permease